MAICNRDLGQSEQINDFSAVVSTAVATDTFVCQAPYPGTLTNVSVAPNTISGSPVIWAQVKRFTAAGATIFPVSVTLSPTAHGLSAAYQSLSLFGPGVTLVQLMAGDVVTIRQEGANTALGNAVVSVAIEASQDIISHFGIQSGN